MPKQRPKTTPKKSQANKKPKEKAETVSITKSKFYWIGLTIAAAVAVLFVGFLSKMAPIQVVFVLAAILLVVAFAGYARLKASSLSFRTRATYVFVGAAVIGYGCWAILTIVLAVTGLGANVAKAVGDQLFLIATQIMFIVMGAFIGEYLSTNNAFQAFASKIKQKF